MNKNQKEPQQIALQFNAYINRQDVAGLAHLMSDDHVFSDSSSGVCRGKDAMLQAWREFFAAYPDYKNHFSLVRARGALVLIAGHSTCSHPLSTVRRSGPPK